MGLSCRSRGLNGLGTWLTQRWVASTYGALAQLVERRLCKADVRSSNLLGSTVKTSGFPLRQGPGGFLCALAYAGHPVCNAIDVITEKIRFFGPNVYQITGGVTSVR